METTIYHILSRGVDKRQIFIDDDDHLRFIHDLFEFNDEEPADNIWYFFNKNNKNQYQSSDLRSHYIERKTRKLIVNILAFCLMPNHYHLLIIPLFENAVVKFMRKLNIGYAKYFNEKYQRKGTLFESRYKSIPITDHSHFVHLPYYIHLNPLDLIMPEWRTREISDYKKAMEFLEKYRWSSFQDYIGKKNFPSVTQRELLNEFFGGPEKYKKDTLNWLKEITNFDEIKEFILE